MATYNLFSVLPHSEKFFDDTFFEKANPYDDMDGFIKQASAEFFMLPIRVMADLTAFRLRGNDDGFILLKGFPEDPELIPTPQEHSEATNRQRYMSEYFLTMVGSHLGSLYGFAQESGGLLFNNIRPAKQSSSVQSSESYDVFLELHTEIAFHTLRPDFVLLYCLRQDQEKLAKTGVSSIRSALPLLSGKAVEQLFKPDFSYAFDYSFGNVSGKQNVIKESPVLEGGVSDPYMTYDSDLITPNTEEARQAIVELDLALRSTMKEVKLEPGDLIVIDNRRASHSRTSFRAYYDGRDRWLQRVFVKQDYDAVRKIIPHQGKVVSEII